MGLIKKVVRGSKNVVNNYTEIEKKVRDATSVDAWMVSTTVLREIAEATYEREMFEQVMSILFKRMGDSGKYWRHVFKSLLLLDYLLKNGAEVVLDRTLDSLHHVKTLREFAYESEDGADHGHDIREKAKKICDLVKNEELLKEERAKATEIRKRLGNHIDHGNRGKSTRGSAKWKGDAPGNPEEEQRQLERALMESALDDPNADDLRQREDEELAMALSASETQHQQDTDVWAARNKADAFPQSSDPFAAQAPPADPFGGSLTQHTSDPFGQPQQTQRVKQSRNSFGHPMAAAGGQQARADLFGPAASSDPFAAMTAAPQQSRDPFGVGAAPAPASSSISALAPPPQSSRRGRGAAPQANDPQVQLANIAKNAVEIDGFSKLAHSSAAASSGAQPAPAMDLFGVGQSSALSGQQVDPFGGVSVLVKAPTQAAPTPSSVLLPYGQSPKSRIDDDEEDGSLWKNKKLVNLDEITALDSAPAPTRLGAPRSTPMNPFALSAAGPNNDPPTTPSVQSHWRAPGAVAANPFKQNISPKMNTLMSPTGFDQQQPMGQHLAPMSAMAPNGGIGVYGGGMNPSMFAAPLQQQAMAGAGHNPFGASQPQQSPFL